MKETGIIMSGDHPRQILDGIKTQTRRVVTPQPTSYIGQNIHRNEITVWKWQIEKDGGFGSCPESNICRWIANSGLCPYGLVGDRLWVRETWAADFMYDDRKPNDIPLCEIARTYYKDDPLLKYSYAGRWRSGRFMRRVSSRITLEITEVRVERLQEITPDDAIVEGVCVYPPDGHGMRSEVRGWFHELWDSLNAKRGYSWDTNPWVWVISFKLAEI